MNQPDYRTRELLRLIKSGDSAAKNELFESHRPALVAAVRAMLRGDLRSVEAEDVVQSVLVKAAEGIDDFEWQRDGSVRAWLAKLAKYEVWSAAKDSNRLRRDPRSVSSLPSSSSRMAPPPSSFAKTVESQRMLYEAIGDLEPDLGELVIDHWILGLTTAEIATKNKWSISTVKRRCAQALMALEKDLKTLRSNRG